MGSEDDDGSVNYISDDDRDSIYFSTIRSRHTVDKFFNGLDQSRLEYHAAPKYPSYAACKKTNQRLYPHVQLDRLTFSRDIRTSTDKTLLRLPVLKKELDNINLELSSGDVLAIMYSRYSDSKCLLDLLRGCSHVTGKVSGEIRINGHKMHRERLDGVIGYIGNDELSSILTIRQYLQLASSIQRPSSKRYGQVYHLINKLMADMNLTREANKLCNQLNSSQWQRVKLAAQMIRDPEILIADNIIQHMDIYDQSYIIDYVRDWAIKMNKIIIMAITPPSMEILKMFSKTVLLASGRVVYFGLPEDMVPYFESIRCPCPSYKNICDYYVDLVTHDNLTMEASRESSIRITRLIKKWNQLKPNLNRKSTGSELMELPRANVLQMIICLLRLHWYYLLNNKLHGIFILTSVFLFSTYFSIKTADMTLILPSGFLQRQYFMENTLYFNNILLGFIFLKKERWKIQKVFQLSFIRYVSSLIYGLIEIIVLISECLIDVIAFFLPIVFFVDFHKNPGLSIIPSIFVNFLILRLLSFIYACLSSELTSYILLCLTYSLLYLLSGFVVSSEITCSFKKLNPISSIGLDTFRYLYYDNFNWLSTKNTTIKMLNCATIQLKSNQSINGPCVQVPINDIIDYYLKDNNICNDLEYLDFNFNVSYAITFIILLSCVWILLVIYRKDIENK